MLYLVELSTLFKRSTFFWQSDLSAFLCWYVLLVRVETFMQHIIWFPTCAGRVRDRQQSSDVTACCTLNFCFRIICQTSTETPFIVSSLDIRKITPKKKSEENQVLLVLLHWNQHMLYSHGHEHQSTTPTLHNSFTRNQTRTRGTREAIKNDLKRFQNSEHAFPLNWRSDTHKGRKKYPELGRNHKKVKRWKVNQVKIEL